MLLASVSNTRMFTILLLHNDTIKKKPSECHCCLELLLNLSQEKDHYCIICITIHKCNEEKKLWKTTALFKMHKWIL